MISPLDFLSPDETEPDHAILINRMCAYLMAEGIQDVIIDMSGPDPVNGGPWLVSSPVHFSAINCTILFGKIESVAPFPGAVLYLDVVDGCTFSGSVAVTAKGGTRYADRVNECCVEIGQAHHTTFEGGFDVRNAYREGVRTTTVSKVIDTQLGLVRAIDCGVTDGVNASSDARVTLTWSGREDDQGNTSTNQLSWVDLSHLTDMGHGHIRELDGLVITANNGKKYYHHIRKLDLDPETGEETGRVGLYPKIRDLEMVSGTAVPVNGAALDLEGGNTSGAQFSRVSAARCPVGVLDGGLYGGGQGGITTENCTICLLINRDIGLVGLGGSYGHVHSESDVWQIGMLGRIDNPKHISSMTTFKPDRMFSLTNVSPDTNPTDGDDENNLQYAALNGVIINHVVQYDEARIQGPNNIAPNALKISNDPLFNNGSLRKSNPTYPLEWDPDLNRLWGYDSAEVVFVGADMGAPGTITFTCDPAHGTVMGQASVAYVFDAPVRITFVRDVAGSNWLLYSESIPALP